MSKTSKEGILEAALDIFSRKGYEATTVGDIALAVGIKAPSLYNHFASKEDLFNSLLDMVMKKYEAHTRFNGAGRKYFETCDEPTEEIVTKHIQDDLRFSITDPYIKKFRHLLAIEQFTSPEMARLNSKLSYDDVMDYYMQLFDYLTSVGVMKKTDLKTTALRFCAPISVLLHMCDIEPDKIDEAMDFVAKHVHEFFLLYREDH